MTRASSEVPRTPGISLAEIQALLGAPVVRTSTSPAFEPSSVALGITEDSRRVGAGDLFVARCGVESDAGANLEHVREAMARGARALIVPSGFRVPSPNCPVFEVEQVGRALGRVAHALYQDPSRAVAVIGITGTNGKTTTTSLVASALGTLGAKVASIGTLGFRFETISEPSLFTTPPADELVRAMARVRAGGGTHVVMEVSSHALVQDRVFGVHFKVAAFTNLTQDHLDYHGDLAAYGAAKALLFTDYAPEHAVLNIDDPFGRSLALRLPACLSVSRLGDADVSGRGLEIGPRGIGGCLNFRGTDVALDSALVGAHNADNLLLGLGVLLELGYPADAAARALGAAPPAPGRLERCDGPDDDVLVLVDYAHTPDALTRALDATRQLSTGRLWCVFGCGGDRDPTKRAPMGDVVGRKADVAIVTNDNPRTEEPARIAEAILSGLSGHRIPYELELDRALAIEHAVASARPGDAVLIAGKGHEPYQIVGTLRSPFDDRSVARRALERRRERQAG